MLLLLVSNLGFAAAQPSGEQFAAGKAFQVGRVDVRSLPEGVITPGGQTKTKHHHQQDPEAFAESKRQAQKDDHVPPGQGEKVIVSPSSGPLSASASPFDGISGDSPNPCSCSPPDAIVAAGPGHVFEMVNLAGKILDKTGNVVKNTFALATLFLIPTDSMSDPYLVFDPSSGRWFASVVDITNGRVQFAVSATSDPTGTWTIYFVSTSSSSVLPDQPFIGTNDDKFVISANDFACCWFYLGVQFWVFNKSELVNQASTIDYATNSPISGLFSVHPAHHFSSTSPSNYFYMVTVGAGTTSTAQLLTLSGVPPLTVFLTIYSFSIKPVSIPPDATQRGTGQKLATNDDRVLSAVWRSSTLWFSLNDACKPNGDKRTRSCARLVQIATSGTAATKSQDFDYALKDNDFFYPAVSLDGSLNLVLVYGSSSSAAYPSLYATGRLANAPANTLQTPVALALGTAPDTSGRYGDYFGAAADPTSGFWVAGEYRVSSVFQSWSTKIARVSIA